MRGLSFQLAFVLWTTLLALVLAPFSPLLSSEQMRGWARRWESGTLVLLRALCGIRLEVRGRPPTEAALIAVKHQSALETVVFHRLVPNVAIPLKRELTRIPLFGYYLLKSGCIPVERDAGTRAMRDLIEAARERLDQGLSLLIFPEGTRVPPGERRPYRPGIAALYLRLARPVVPVALYTGHVWGRGWFQKRPGTAVIVFLDPIPPGLDRQQFMARLEREIESASTALLPDQSADRSPGPGSSP